MAIYYRNIIIEKAERIQDEFNGVYGALEKYKPKKEPYIEKRRKLLINADNFYKERKMIIDAFKNKIFPMVPTSFSEDEESPRGKKDDRLPTMEEKEEEPTEEEPKEEVSEQITELDKFNGGDLIYKYFLENSLIKFM